MDNRDIDFSEQLGKLKNEKDILIEKYNGVIRFEEEREFDMDLFYQRAIIDNDESLSNYFSAEVDEIRQDQKRLFYMMQEERDEFRSQFKKNINTKLENIDNKINEIKAGENKDEYGFVPRSFGN